VGVVAEGRAVGKGKAYEIGDIIGQGQILGYEQCHPRTIIAESDGVIVAMRIADFLSIDKPALKNRIFHRLAQAHSAQITKREELSSSFEQFETVEEKKVAKYLTP
jgi:hypothetical protein